MPSLELGSLQPLIAILAPLSLHPCFSSDLHSGFRTEDLFGSGRIGLRIYWAKGVSGFGIVGLGTY